MGDGGITGWAQESDKLLSIKIRALPLPGYCVAWTRRDGGGGGGGGLHAGEKLDNPTPRRCINGVEETCG